jgi:hypothetical protein
MKLNLTEVKTLIEQAKEVDTYICGADGKLCGMARNNTPFPCKQCKRNAAINPSDDDFFCNEKEV